jgi:hypothetical protein
MPLNQILELLGGGPLLGANGRPDVDVTALEGKTVALYFRWGSLSIRRVHNVLVTMIRELHELCAELDLGSARGDIESLCVSDQCCAHIERRCCPELLHVYDHAYSTVEQFARRTQMCVPCSLVSSCSNMLLREY